MKTADSTTHCEYTQRSMAYDARGTGVYLVLCIEGFIFIFSVRKLEDKSKFSGMPKTLKSRK
jgi:hypothetical protein